MIYRRQSALRLAVLLLTIFVCSCTRAHSDSVLDDSDYAVIAAAVQQTRIRGPMQLLMVSDRTASFECPPADKHMINVGACAGMRMDSKMTPDQMLEMVRSSVPGVDEELTSMLQSRSEKSLQVEKPLPLSVKQDVWGPDRPSNPSAGQGSPDMAIEFSPVGFNAAQTKAIVYVGSMFWTDAAGSFGEYLYLVRDGDNWKVAGRMRVWQLEAPGQGA